MTNRGRFTIIDADESDSKNPSDADEGSQMVILGSFAEIHRSAYSQQSNPSQVDMVDSQPLLPTTPANACQMDEHPQDQAVISPNSEENIPFQLLHDFQETLCSKFSEMLKLHRDIMLELINKEVTRDDQVKGLVSEISELTKQNTVLEIENKNLKNIFKES